MTYTKIRPVRRWLPALLIAASLLTAIQPARAQDGLGAPPRIVTEPGGVAITWSGGPTAETAAAAARATLPVLYYQGYNLPLQMIALTVAPGAAPGLQVNGLEAVELPGGVAPSAPEAPAGPGLGTGSQSSGAHHPTADRADLRRRGRATRWPPRRGVGAQPDLPGWECRQGGDEPECLRARRRPERPERCDRANRPRPAKSRSAQPWLPNPSPSPRTPTRCGRPRN